MVGGLALVRYRGGGGEALSVEQGAHMKEMMMPGRHEIGLAPYHPGIYVLADEPLRAAYGAGPSWAKEGEVYQIVHAISPVVGGEVRGYWLCREKLWLRMPLWMDWPELDAEVVRVADTELVQPCSVCWHYPQRHGCCCAPQHGGSMREDAA